MGIKQRVYKKATEEQKAARREREKEARRQAVLDRKDMTDAQKARKLKNMRDITADPIKAARYREALAEGRAGGTHSKLPPEAIDFGALESLYKIQCTQIEVASFFKRSEDTIRRLVEEHYNALDENGRLVLDGSEPELDEQGKQKHKGYKEIVKKLYAPGRVSLRRAQFKSAIQTEIPSMQIWLGKQFLGQQDNAVPNEDDDREKVEFDIREGLYNEESPIQTIP